VEDAGSRENLIDRVIEKFGRVDVLVNNAGRAVLEPVVDMKLATMVAQTELYMMAPLHLSLLVIPHMRKQGAGWIVNLGSSSVTSTGNPGERGLALYGALKAAVHRFTAGFALELKEQNIAVNVVSPVTMILTPGTNSLGLNSPEMQPHHERVEHLAEATVALVTKPPRDQTGVVAFSHQYLDTIGRSTMSLDGMSVVQQRGR
jgi:3-oxoacyl-[acyl-carrier protein] reductase